MNSDDIFELIQVLGLGAVLVWFLGFIISQLNW